MATHDPPWRLDPLKNIVNVGWGGSVLVLGFEFTFETTQQSISPAPSWNAFIATGTDAPSLRGLSLLEELGPVVQPPGPPPVVPPIVTDNDYWCYPRVKTDDTVLSTQLFHIVDVGRYVITTNLGTINSYSDAASPSEHLVPFRIDANSTTLITSGGGGDNTLGALADGFDSFLSGYMQFVVDRTLPGSTTIFQTLIEEISGHDAVVSTTTYTKRVRTITFVNMARITGANPSIKAAGELQIVVEMQGAKSTEFLAWHVGAAVYLGTKKFNLSDGNAVFIEPDPARNAAGIAEEDSIDNPEQAKPKVEVTFTVNLSNYDITASRRNL